MKTQYYTATSRDGCIATSDDSVDWLFPLGELAETGCPEFVREVGAPAMGPLVEVPADSQLESFQ